MSAGEKYDRFEAWLKENGANFDFLELREYDAPPDILEEQEEKKESQLKDESEMRGVHARSHIPPNTTCLQIPRKCLITVEMGQATPLGQAILNSDLDLDAPKHIFLMIYVLWDRMCNGSNSFFHPYYEILPRTLRNMPVFWSQEELAQLEGSYLLSQIADRNEAIAEDYHSICQVAPELYDLCSLEEFKWARMCVCSRNFGLQIDGHRTSALVPHADMLNHFRPRETKWTFDEEKQAFTITTLQSIPAGAQVYDSYGQKCNHRFLLNYGFAVEDNRELDGFCPNEVPIELSVSLDDPCFQKKVEFWTRGENASFAAAVAAVTTSQSQQAVINAVEVAVHQQETDVAPVKRVRVCVSNNENTRLLFSLLRTLVCTEDELSALSTDMVSRSLFGLDTKSSQPLYRSCRDIRHPVSLRNERAAMRLLLDTVSIALSRYPTTLSRDTSDLMDEVSFPRFSNRRHAKIQVKGEKEVLTHFVKWGNTALEVMDLIQEGQSIERTIANIEECGLHHTIIRYCADVLTALQREEMKNLRRRA